MTRHQTRVEFCLSNSALRKNQPDTQRTLLRRSLQISVTDEPLGWLRLAGEPTRLIV